MAFSQNAGFRSIMPLSPRFILLLSFYAVFVSCSTTSDPPPACKQCLHNLALEALRQLWTTAETAVRGFLLGFGAAVLKDLLIDRKATASEKPNFQSTFAFARVVGLGAASFLIGAAILIPANLSTRC